MSCEIKLLSSIVELKEVQEYFGLSSEENWVNAVQYSLAPTSDILTFGHGSLFVILSTKWNREKQLNFYRISYKGAIDSSFVTAILNVPIIGGQGVSSHASIDWTCVAIGMDNGFVSFYSDSGNLIYSQQWHNEPVQSIKAQSGKHVNEELYISYVSCVCIIQGIHLFPILKTLKHQISKFSSNKTDLQTVEQIPCKKWSFGGRGMTISDCVVVGPQKVCSFDHLSTASLEGGFYAKYRSSAPQNSLVISAGAKPYVGFHYAKEGFAQPVLADVARAVASKIKSALPSWFGGSQSQQAESQIQLTPSEPMVCRFGLCDLQRNAFSVWIAPGNKLAAVADNLGRIILVDCMKGIAVRIWKGYREAQCGFVEVTEKLQKHDKSTERRKALFLIIYAPRRAVIEIWSLQNGPKVAAFTASRNGHLIYNPHSLMGVTPSISRVKYTHQTCIFFDATDNSLKEITIPFHCALSDANSKTAKDLHLLKRLKICLKSGDGSEDDDVKEMNETCQSFQTDDIKIQCVEMLVKNKKINAKLFKIAVEAFVKEEADEQSNSNLQIVCRNYLKLTNFYLSLNSTDESLADSKEAGESIKLSESELATIQKLIDLSTINSKSCKQPSSKMKVKFEEKTKKINIFVDYLAAFNVANDELILLKSDSIALYKSVGEILYDKIIPNGNLSNFVEAAKDAGLLHEDVLKLYLAYWLGRRFDYLNSEELINDMTKFNLILRKICILAADKVKFGNNTICLWWQNVREYLLESSCALRGLLAAIMCRNEALKYEEQGNDEEYNFEEVSQEACQWTLLIGKLDDVAVLGTILSDSLTCTDPVFTTLIYSHPDISLKQIIKGGKGIVSELVAKWLAASGIHPEKIVEVAVLNENEGECSNLKNVYKNHQLISADISGEGEKKTKDDTDLDPVLYNLNLLRQHFPFSLESGKLLCQLTWEYMCDWSKNLPNINYLIAGMTCLKTIPRLQYALKHGLCCMIWNAHLKIPLEATKKLVNKVGRLPKERLCLQDIGISDSKVPQFLEICIEFLEHFAKSIDYDKIELRFEELLQDGPIPLTSLALQQNCANMVLVKLHSELATVLFLLTSFNNVKHQKPIQHLFDGMANQSFFNEINRPLAYTLPKSDLILRKSRTEYLCKTITATMDVIVEDLENVFYAAHINWMECIERLADVWDLNISDLKKHQIAELYAHGWDTYAEELLESVVAEQNLGKMLLAIAGRRLTIYTKENPNVWAQVAAVGPLLTDYLDTLIASDNVGPQIHLSSNDISIEKLTKLTGQAFKCVSGKDSRSRDLRIAGLLFDACATIKDMR